MRIGFVPNLDRAAGGTYQYAVTMVDAIKHLPAEDDYLLYTYPGESLPAELADVDLPRVELRAVSGMTGSLWSRFARVVPRAWRAEIRSLAVKVLAPRSARGGQGSSAGGGADGVDPLWSQWFAKQQVDLLVYTTDSDLPFKTGVPYVVAIHDLQHRLHPEFEEVSADGEGARREYRIGNDVRSATVVLVDSEVGKEDMLTFYGPEGLSPEAVCVLPFLPATYLSHERSADDLRAARDKYGLPDVFLFYPAQFAPSKNHVRIVEALGHLRSRGLDVALALAGPRSGDLRERTFAQTMQAVEDAGVSDLVHYLGYVPDEDMFALFAGSLGLIMPTFFGPTNIPVAEAWSAGCPVITSDIRGMREQAGDAALLVDPLSVESIADAIERLATDPSTRADLIARGSARLAEYTREDYVRRLTEALDRAKREVVRSR